MAKPVFGRQKPFVFLKEVKNELSKVIWPTRAQATKLTAIVVGVSVIVGVFIGTLDFLFTKLMGLILGR
jgi:preprotein translocase subunit SecE